MDTIASRYAKALVELAIENNQVEDYQKQMKFIYSVVSENAELIEFLKCYTIDDRAKKELIEKIFSKNVFIEILHFIYLLIDKKRVDYLLRICKEFNSECNEYRNILEGKIYSVSQLSEDQISKLEENITKKLNKKVELTNIIEPSIIGGIKIVVNDTVFDNSVSNRLQALKQELINGKDAN